MSETLALLIITDDPDDLAAIRALLSDRFALSHCETLGDAGKKLAAGARFDLILCDLNLPDYQGENAIEMAIAFAEGIPLIIRTTLTDPEMAYLTQNRGVLYWLRRETLKAVGFARALELAARRSSAPTNNGMPLMSLLDSE